MRRKPLTTPKAAAIGPYSHAIEADGFIYLSGQTPISPETGQLVEGSVADQTRQCFENLFAVLEAGGLTETNVVNVQVYLTAMESFAAMNEVYATMLSEPYPARTTIGVAALPLGAQIEIGMTAKR